MFIFAYKPGPDGMGPHIENFRESTTLAVVAGIICLISFVIFAIGPLRWPVPLILLGLLILHPRWSIGGQGDGGEQMRQMSWLCLYLGGAVICWQVGRF